MIEAPTTWTMRIAHDLSAALRGELSDEIRIPVMRDKFARGWPEHRTGFNASYTTLADAFTSDHATDAHFAAYSVPDKHRRLASPAVFDKLPDGVPMVLFVVDVEPEGHAAVTPEWWAAERAKLDRMLADHPGAFVYRTRGGYRIVYVLAVPFVLRSPADAERWKATYLAWLAYVRERYQIDGDESCQDWTRLQRLPRVVRDGVRQEPETLGDAAAIGEWDVEVTIAEPEPKQPREPSSSYTTKEGDFDPRAFMAERYPGVHSKSTSVADRYDIECPWAHEHSTKSGSRETAVFVYPSGAWEFKCQHNHCAHRDYRDLRQWHQPDWTPFDPNAPKRASQEPPPDQEDYDMPDEAYAPTMDEAECAEAEEFACGIRGIFDIPQNIKLAVRKLGASVSFDEFSQRELIAGLPGFGPRLDDAALSEMRLTIEERYAFKIGKERFCDVVMSEARRNRFHPVKQYLDALEWDGEPRIDRWLIDYAGAPDTSYVLAISRLVLVAAVRRIRRPGCKFDEMVILESPQGKVKSSGLRILAVRDEWFTDELPLDGDAKKLIEQTQGIWIAEAGELKGMNRGDVAALKSMLSRQIDEARLAYGRLRTVAPRQFVIIGTTNETEDYLRDPTGNRRFWPVRIEAFNLDMLKRDRDQLWAEAANAEARGESIRLDPALYAEAAAEQGEREIDDPIEVTLREQLGNRRGKIRTLDIWELLNIEPGKATDAQNTRMGAAMRRLGWERSRRRIEESHREYVYVRGSDWERQEPIRVDVIGVGDARVVNVSGGVL